MEHTSFILPLNTWAYLLGLQGCANLWCLMSEQPVDPEEGLACLLKQGLAMTDGTTILIDPYLLKISQEMARGQWCARFECENGQLSIIMGENVFVKAKRISPLLYRIGIDTDDAPFFGDAAEEILENEWETIRLVLTNPTAVLGERTITRDRFPHIYNCLQGKEQETDGR